MRKLASILCLCFSLSVFAAEDPLPFTTNNPVIFVNDWSLDGYDLPMAMAMASAGTISLRGIVVCNAWTNSWNQYNSNWAGVCCSVQTNTPQLMQEFQHLVDVGRYVGFQNVPNPVPGPHQQLTRPANTNIDETLARTSVGTSLILSEAQAATAAVPLVVYCGGQLTAPVSAYLLDTNIQDKMVLAWHGNASTNNDDFNAMADPWAAYIALQRLRVVAGVNNNSITNAFPAHIPATKLTNTFGDNWLRQHMGRIVQGKGGAGQFFGQLPWEVDSVGLTLLYSGTNFITTSKYVTFGAFMDSLNFPGITHLCTFTDSGVSNRYRLITVGNTNAHTAAWWGAMTNAAAYRGQP